MDYTLSILQFSGPVIIHLFRGIPLHVLIWCETSLTSRPPHVVGSIRLFLSHVHILDYINLYVEKKSMITYSSYVCKHMYDMPWTMSDSPSAGMLLERSALVVTCFEGGMPRWWYVFLTNVIDDNIIRWHVAIVCLLPQVNSRDIILLSGWRL